jgi:hypothetical protein
MIAVTSGIRSPVRWAPRSEGFRPPWFCAKQRGDAEGQLVSRDGLQAFADQGWMVLDLPDPRIVFAVRDRLLARLRALLAVDLDCLEQYHTVVDDDARHIDVLYDLATTFWQEQLGVEIVRCNLAPLQRLVGLDLHVQTYPYLRAARPHRPQDCSGLHRDTY